MLEVWAVKSNESTNILYISVWGTCTVKFSIKKSSVSRYSVFWRLTNTFTNGRG